MSLRTIAEDLSRYAAGVDTPPLQVTGRAKACLLHALAVGMAGTVAEFGRYAEQTSVGTADKPSARGYARSLVTGRWHPLEAAAFINGVHLHARAQEDTHGTFHPGVCVIPAALAAAEDENVDGATFLHAVVVGYEVGIALSEPLTEITTPPFRATAVFGPVAAAAAVGRIRGFDTQTMQSAVAIAASLSGGTAESFGAGTDEWHFQSGTSAATGLRAAQLAAAGVVGSRSAFEARSGFLDCFARGTDPGERSPDTWNILGVTFKPYPVCAFNQVPAMVAVRLHRSAIRPQDISSVQLSMNEREATYPGMPAAGPFTSVSNTLMSARFAFATGLVTGNITYGSLQNFDDPDVLAMVAKTTLRPEPGRPPKTAHAHVVLNDGSTREESIDDSDALLSWEMADVVANARRLTSEVGISENQLENITAAVESIDRQPSVEAVLAAVLAAAAVPL